ncbi:hypothetical protein W02_19710 [Nitrospira sp. KM1]|uniref:hypothetical protein n=1 Tax=Nitrospira sp. KM1 TaxID=1936990 RepID=UPI0013A73438|nr:hypothetical protein [Nitrospira sp. KM1]BCA54831.1 hypothetical protein W02_19710 [Nitrospira sp. KM1]
MPTGRPKRVEIALTPEAREPLEEHGDLAHNFCGRSINGCPFIRMNTPRLCGRDQRTKESQDLAGMKRDIRDVKGKESFRR